MVAQTNALLYLGTFCMIMVKDKLFIEHNIFSKTSTKYAWLRPEVGVVSQCVLVCGVVCVQNKSRSKQHLDLDLDHLFAA